MIFYFSGTGNSYAVAMQLQLRLQGELINITDCVQNEKYCFAPAEGEPVGIVCPVYFDGLPSIVYDFMDRMTFEPKPSYVFGVLTYGGALFGAKSKFVQKTAARGLETSAIWTVHMPANYAMLYEPTHEKAAESILEKAGEKMEQICESIQKRERIPCKQGKFGIFISDIMYRRYDKARSTKPFYTNDQCVSCGVCAGRCPVKAIEMIDGTPTWVKDKCVFCMSCVRCNAIQYGNKLNGRYRYRHPIYQKKKKQSDCH